MEQEKELGNRLRAKREELGLSVGEITQETKIRSKYIQAIENGEFEKIPGEVYLKGFIKTYAKILGLDSAEILSQIPVSESEDDPKYISSKKTEQQNQNANNSLYNYSEELPSRKNKKLPHENVNRTQSIRSLLKLLVFALILVMLLTYVYNIIILNNLPDPVDNGNENDPDDDGNGNVPDDNGSENPQEPEEPDPVLPEINIVSDSTSNSVVEVKADSIELRVTASQICWLRVQIDDNPAESQTLQPGDSLDFAAENLIQIRAGNSGGIEISLYEEILDVSGQNGGVKNYTIEAIQ